MTFWLTVQKNQSKKSQSGLQLKDKSDSIKHITPKTKRLQIRVTNVRKQVRNLFLLRKTRYHFSHDPNESKCHFVKRIPSGKAEKS